jgi:protein gp37
VSTDSSIEWTQSTWNPVTGCTRTSSGCQHCYFFKQWGGFNKKKAGRLLEGRTWDEMPALAGAGV